MDLGFPVIIVAVVIVVLYLLSAIKILRNTRRRRYFSPGTLAWGCDRAGAYLGIRSTRSHCPGFAPAGRSRSAATGRHHSR